MKKRAISQEEKQKRKQDILNTALKLFKNKNYKDIKIEEIAKKTGIAKGTVFFYFKTKEELFLELTMQGFQKLFDLFNLNLDKYITDNNKMNIDDFINALEDPFEKSADLFRLIAITNVVLEQNINYSAAKSFKVNLYNNLIKTGTKIESCMNFLKKYEGIKLLIWTYSLIIGFQHLSYPSEIAEEVIIKENMHMFKINFKEQFFSTLKTLLIGLKSQYN